MNEFLRNADRIEFIITLACTGKCKHCSEGDHVNCTDHIDTEVAVKAVRDICANFNIRSLMTFGGEPLLYPDTACAIHATAKQLGIPHRQLITNGFFSKDPAKIESTAEKIAASGVNDLLLSVDAFHQETIPLEPVKLFAESLSRNNVAVKLTPAWLVSREDDNPYNAKTRENLHAFDYLGLPTGEGNVIFPSGNALKYLKDYFGENPQISSPYDEDPRDVRSISFDANGDVLNGNVYQKPIMEIIEEYRP